MHPSQSRDSVDRGSKTSRPPKSPSHGRDSANDYFTAKKSSDFQTNPKSRTSKQYQTAQKSGDYRTNPKSEKKTIPKSDYRSAQKSVSKTNKESWLNNFTDSKDLDTDMSPEEEDPDFNPFDGIEGPKMEQVERDNSDASSKLGLANVSVITPTVEALTARRDSQATGTSKNQEDTDSQSSLGLNYENAPLEDGALSPTKPIIDAPKSEELIATLNVEDKVSEDLYTSNRVIDVMTSPNPKVPIISESKNSKAPS
jgi:hypothetical protein